MTEPFELLRVIAVIGLVVAAAALATPKGRLPLALRGVMRILRRDRGLAEASVAVAPPSVARRTLAFLLVVVAVVLAIV